jgi:predicted nucleotidyltransferase
MLHGPRARYDVPGDRHDEPVEIVVRTAMQIDDDRDILPQVVPALREVLGDRLRSVVLFGSRARGDHHQDSDWDLLVIAGCLPGRSLERYRMLKAALPPGTRGSAGMLAVTPAEFEARMSDVYLDIALDGQILYDREGYAARKLAEIRRIIDKAGLYRQRTKSGDLWSWREPPVGRWSIEWER